MKKNFYVELLFVAMLILFSVYRYFYNVESVVLKIFSPTMYAIDLNGNRHLESEEIVCLSRVKTFDEDLTNTDEELARKFDISDKAAIVMAVKARNYADALLSNQVVQFVADEVQSNQNCIHGDVYVNNKSFRKLLLDEGLAYSSDEDFNVDLFNSRIVSAADLHPVVMNRKSKKYHEIGCKFGKVSEDYAIFIKEDLPQNAVPCKWCHKGEEVKALISDAFPDMVSDGNMKIFLTDMSSHLKVKSDCSSNVCQAYLSEIKNAKETIDIATYGWVSIDELDKALQDAVLRGVKLRLVYDFSPKNEYYPDTSKIARFAIETRNDLALGNSRLSNYLMHNKFTIFDGQKVVTGSLNYSKTDFSEFNSNFITFINSADIANVYTAEFEQMLAGVFHTEKVSRSEYKIFQLDGTDVEIYFSPQDKTITNKVINYVDNAQKYIYMPVFVITHKGLESALLYAKARGVDVKLIVDAMNVFAQKSIVQNLRRQGVDVKVENFAGKLHSKSIIIDDKYILAGSMNFSRSGESKNDENMLIIKNPRFAVYYRDFFNYLWNKIPEMYLTRAPRAESSESLGSCFDGIDNDFDGRIDKADEGCMVAR